MKAWALVDHRKFKQFEVDKPTPGPQEVLVQVKACGVCSSELHHFVDPTVEIDQPMFMGHEVSGIVEKVGSEVTRVSEGERVTVYAQKGFAEYCSVHEDYVLPISDQIPFELAVSEPIACAMNATKRSGVEVGDTVVIIGLGFMGSLILQGINLKGANQIIAIDQRPESLAIAQQLGADVVIDGRKENAHEKVMQLTNGQGADVVIEATGAQKPLDLATEMVRIRGHLVIFGYHQGGPRSVDMQSWNWKGLDVVNAHERAPEQYMEGIRVGMKLLESGKLTMKPLVTHTFSLEQINEAFEATHQKPEGFIKAVVLN